MLFEDVYGNLYCKNRSDVISYELNQAINHLDGTRSHQRPPFAPREQHACLFFEFELPSRKFNHSLVFQEELQNASGIAPFNAEQSLSKAFESLTMITDEPSVDFQFELSSQCKFLELYWRTFVEVTVVSTLFEFNQLFKVLVELWHIIGPSYPVIQDLKHRGVHQADLLLNDVPECIELLFEDQLMN